VVLAILHALGRWLSRRAGTKETRVKRRAAANAAEEEVKVGLTLVLVYTSSTVL
jgi:hypothetical protein